MTRLRPLALLLLPLLVGCATYATIGNQPLTSAAAAAPGYDMGQVGVEGRRDDVTLALAFSGGGSRAAALAYGVLLELRETRVGAAREHRLLDEVDAISAVSGGSFTAAYYGLHDEATFRDFEPGFLRRDLNADVLQRVLNPLRWFTPEGRTAAAATLYDTTIFKGATFADLQRRGGPLIVINATDLEAGTRFAFLQEHFDLLCSDLRGFPLAQAVAASSAVRVLMEPVVLENHAGCAPPALPQPPADSPQLQQVVDGLRSYAENRYSLDTYIVLDEDNTQISDPARLEHIRSQLEKALSHPDQFPTIVQKRLPRQLKHFSVKTTVNISNDIQRQQTVLEVITLDRPGLLARIGLIFMEHGVNLLNARIATLGERAEDVFFITDRDGHPISTPELCGKLADALRNQLDTVN